MKKVLMKKRLITTSVAIVMCLLLFSLFPATTADNEIDTVLKPFNEGPITVQHQQRTLSNALIAGANYLLHAQADITEDNAGNGFDGIDETPDDPDDGGWDWRLTSPAFTHSTSNSPTNIYGATALGLYYSYVETGNSSYFTALTDCANQLITNDTTYRTSSDVTFLLLYQSLPGTTANIYKTSAKAKYDGRIALYGNATALAEYIRDVRAGQGYENGIIAWDIGKWVVAADMLNTEYPGNGYDTDADDMAEVLWQDSFNDNPGYFDIIDDQGFDPTYTNKSFWWYTLGISGLIDAFDAAQVHTTELSGLLTILLDCQYDSGAFSFSYGANTDDEDWQSTAYSVMSLAYYDQITYQNEINQAFCWTASTQDSASGGWVYSSGNHYPEVGGENLASLYFADGPVQNIDTGEIFCTIQAAISDTDTIDGHTITIDPGMYPEVVNMAGKELTINGSGIGQTIINASSSAGYAISNFGDNTTFKDVTLIGSSHYGFKVSHVKNINLENIRVENSGKTGIDLNTVGTASLSNIEVVDTVSGFGIMILDSNNVTVTDITTINNPWGGVSVHAVNANADNISFYGTFDAQEPAPLLLESDPPYADFVNVDIPSKFNYVVYGLRVGPNYKQWFYQETLTNAKTFANSLLTSGFTYSDMIIYDYPAKDNYYVIPGMLIQDAIDDATSTDTVHIDTGLYQENIVVDKGLTLIASSNPVVDGMGNVCISIQSSDITINGLELVNGSAGVQGYLGSPSNGDGYQNIHILNNHIHNIVNTAAPWGFGIYLGTEGERYNPSHGMYDPTLTSFMDFTGLLIDGNIINDTSGASVTLQSLYATTGTLNFTNNEVFNGAQSALWIDSCWDIYVFENNLHDCGNGIFISSYSDGYYEGNPNQQWDSKNIDIIGNDLQSNTNGFVLWDGWPSLINVNQNNIVGNSAGFTNNLAENMSGTCNWWGDISGPTHTNNPAGTGDSCSNYVIFTPWLDQAYPDGDCVGGVCFDPIWVDDDEATGWYDEDHVATIQTAVDRLCDGGTIYVSPGTYIEDVNIDKSLTLIGSGDDQTFVKSSSKGPVFTITSNNVIIQDLEITDDTQLVEGIRISTGATTDLTLENVDFTNLGNNPGPGNAYGIVFDTSFTNFFVDNCDFIATNLGEYSRAIGIFAGKNNGYQLSNINIENSTFTYMYVGIYISAETNGLHVKNNVFGPWELEDCAAAVAGLYMGDGKDNYDIENIVVTGNTFTEYGRGVYSWNYAPEQIYGAIDISDNTFTDSIWSAGIRFYNGYYGTENISYQGPISIHDNVFTQSADVGANVAMIDLRTYSNSKNTDIAITNNEITFSGSSYVDAMYGIQFIAGECPFNNTLVENNIISGGNVGGAGTVPSSGINIIHYSDDYWPTLPFEMDILTNNITGFDHGVSIYDNVNAQFGGLPSGSLVNINYNNIFGNALYGIRNDNSESINAECNWWGDTSGPTHVSNAYGTGDAVSDNVDYTPWLDLVYPDGDCVGGICADPVWVDDDAAASWYDWDHCADIQTAVNRVCTGGTIYVSSGTYPEEVYVYKSLTLLGPNAGIHGTSGLRVDEATIRLPDGLTGPGGYWGVPVYIEADDVTIDGFTITDDGYETSVGYDYFTGIASNRANNTLITNNIVVGFNYTSIILFHTHPAELPIDGIEISDNLVIDNVGLYHAIYVQGAGGTVSGNTVDNCGGCIQIQPYAQPNGGIVTNNILNGYVNGIYYNYAKMGAGSWIIEENDISRSSAPSALKGNTANEDNILDLSSLEMAKSKSGVNWSGLYLRTHGTSGTGAAPYVEFNDNNIDGSGATDPYWDQIRAVQIRNIHESSLGTFYGNNFTNADAGVFIYDDANVANVEFHQNNFIGNTVNVENTNMYDLNATCNWWGHITGPYHPVDNPSGDAANVSDNVTFIPWLSDLYPYGDCDIIPEYLAINQSVHDRGFPVRHAADGDWGAAQSFSPTAGYLSKIQIYLRKFGVPEFDLTVELRTGSPEGTLLDSITITQVDVPTTWQWMDIEFDNIEFIPGIDYFIVLPPAPSGVTTSFGYEWGYAFGDQYPGGSFWFTRDGGALWRGLPTMYEFVFKVYGLG